MKKVFIAFLAVVFIGAPSLLVPVAFASSNDGVTVTESDVPGEADVALRDGSTDQGEGGDGAANPTDVPAEAAGGAAAVEVEPDGEAADGDADADATSVSPNATDDVVPGAPAPAPAPAASESRRQGRAVTLVPVSFALANAAQPFLNNTRGAMLHLEGTRDGQPFVSDYLTNDNRTFPAVPLDEGTIVNFVVNYYFTAASQPGGGFNKITGSYTVGAAALTASDISGTSVPATMAVSPELVAVTLANDLTAARGQYTTYSARGVRFLTIPEDANVMVYDDRDGTLMPGFNYGNYLNAYRYTFALPVPKTIGPVETFSYVIQREGYEDATGQFSVVRTVTSGNGTPTVELVAASGEASYTWAPDTSNNPHSFTVALNVAQRTETVLEFSVSAVSQMTVITAETEDGTPLSVGGREVIVPASEFGKKVNWTASAPGFRTLTGQYQMAADGTVIDLTEQSAKDGAISYSFDASMAVLTAKLRPSPSVIEEGTVGGVVNLQEQLMGLFSEQLNTVGGRVTGGTLEFTNTLGYTAIVTGAQVTSEPTMVRDVFRTISDPAAHVLGAGGYTFTRLSDIVSIASERYPGASIKSPGGDFVDYSDYLLYYFRENLSGTNAQDYSNITSLSELTVLDRGQLFNGNIRFNIDDAYMTFDLSGPSEIDVPYIMDRASYILFETDPELIALAKDLAINDALYFTLDSTLAAGGELPMTHTAVETGAYEGLQFADYRESTEANQAKVAEMIDGIVLAPGESHVFNNVSVSVIGTYLWNGFLGNGLNFDFNIQLKIMPVGIDGYIFDDIDTNGSYDTDETIYEDMTVSLFEEGNDATPVAQTQTNDLGYYLFAQGPNAGQYNYDSAKSYYVAFDVPDGSAITTTAGPGLADDNRFAQTDTVAKSEVVSFVTTTHNRLNGGLVPVPIVDPTPGPTDPEDPTPGPTDPTPGPTDPTPGPTGSGDPTSTTPAGDVAPSATAGGASSLAASGSDGQALAAILALALLSVVAGTALVVRRRRMIS